ncbi:MAG: acetylornithine deacetylase, partial [Abyssibacter sp.]|nr:acetylornithine deacetylase [Abyssibacter sp.]
MKGFVNRLPDPVAMMQSLIALPSISSAQPSIDQSNRAVAEQLATWLQPLGFRCELLPLPRQPDKCNLVATLGQGSGG